MLWRHDRRAFLEACGWAAAAVSCSDGPLLSAPASPDAEALPDAEPPPADAGAEPDADVEPDATIEADAGAIEDAATFLDLESLPEAGDRFPLGIAAGDPTTDGMRAWARYDGASALGLVVFEEADPTSRAEAPVSLADGFAAVDVSGLRPGTWHRYGFTVNEGAGPVARSRIGRFRTAPAKGTREIVRIGASACTSNIRSRFATLERAGARTDLDLFILLGDTSYNDGADNLDEYRERYAQNLSKQGYLDVRAATGVVATWDDHEVGNNWDPETIDPAHLAVAKQAFLEHLPIRPTSPGRIWRSLSFGDTVDLFVLDGRSERRPSTRSTAGAEYLSRAQMDWLEDGLSASTAVFKLIVSSVPIAAMPSSFDLGGLLAPGDRWDGYPAAREELLGFIEGEAIEGVVFLSGDFHLAYTGWASETGVGSTVLEVLAGPGAQFPNPLDGFLRAPQFDFATREMNYAELILDPASREITIRYFGEDGDVFAERTYER
jgi:alkaline phosphatase D